MFKDKKLIVGAMLALTLAVAGCGGAPATTEEAPAATDVAEITVTQKVDATVAGGETSEVEVAVPEGGTVYDALVLSGVDYADQDGEYGIYVTAIGGIGENANGTNGGWVYTVNDEEVMVGCTEYVLEPGDVIQWSYITW